MYICRYMKMYLPYIAIYGIAVYGTLLYINNFNSFAFCYVLHTLSHYTWSLHAYKPYF